MTCARVSCRLRINASHCVCDFVAAHPDGGTLDEVAEALGISREMVSAVEQVALERFVRRAHEARVLVRRRPHRVWWDRSRAPRAFLLATVLGVDAPDFAHACGNGVDGEDGDDL